MLSGAMQREVAEYIYGTQLRKVQMFRKTHDAFIKDIACQVGPQSLPTRREDDASAALHHRRLFESGAADQWQQPRLRLAMWLFGSVQRALWRYTGQLHCIWLAPTQHTLSAR